MLREIEVPGESARSPLLPVATDAAPCSLLLSSAEYLPRQACLRYRSWSKSYACQRSRVPGLPLGVSRHISHPAHLITRSGTRTSCAMRHADGLGGMFLWLLPTCHSQNGNSAEHPSEGLDHQKKTEWSARLPKGHRAEGQEEGWSLPRLHTHHLSRWLYRSPCCFFWTQNSEYLEWKHTSIRWVWKTSCVFWGVASPARALCSWAEQESSSMSLLTARWDVCAINPVKRTTKPCLQPNLRRNE